MANKKKLKKKAREQAKAGKLSSRLVTRLESAGVKKSTADRFRNQNQAAIRASSPSAAPSPTPARTTPEVKGIKQALKIAGGGAGIGKEELRTILAETNQPGKLIQRLDDINTKLSKKDKAGIGLTSGAANMLIRKGTKYKQKGGPVSPWNMMIDGDKRNKYDFGTGFIGSALTERLGSAGTMAVPAQRNKTYNSGFTPGSGRAATDPTPGRLLDQGMDIGPKGRGRVRGIGKQYEVPERFLGGDETLPPPDDNNDVGDVGDVGDGATDPILPEEPETPVDNSLSSGAGGLDLASWATGFRAARSARRRAGKGSQGLGSMKKAPFTSWFK